MSLREEQIILLMVLQIHKFLAYYRSSSLFILLLTLVTSIRICLDREVISGYTRYTGKRVHIIYPRLVIADVLLVTLACLLLVNHHVQNVE